MEKRWRLILDRKRDGFENMAVDEAILCGYAERRTPTLRIYGWLKPTLSLGYRQDYRRAIAFPENVSFVRRLTGGAAILHDRELTYSCVCARGDLDLPPQVKKSYYLLCSFLKNFYLKLGLHAAFAYEANIHNDAFDSEYCFSSWQEADLIINEKKIGGNAQRRKRDIIFQHGSIPQKINARHVANVMGTCQDVCDRATCLDILLNRDTEFMDLQNMLAQSFEESFDVELVKQPLSEKEEVTAARLLQTKYTQEWWNKTHEKAAVVG